MSLWKRPDSQFWQIRFEIAGHTVRRSSETTDRRAAQELEKQLRDDLWRQIKLGEKRFTWGDAVAQCRLEDSKQKSWDRTERSLKILGEYFPADQPLIEIDYANLLKVRSLLELRTSKGNGWKTKRPWKPSTVNRVLAVAGSILTRAAGDDWKMLDKAPNVPLFELPKSEPPILKREDAIRLLARFPLHTADMSVFALATGLRRSNVTDLVWERIDLERRCCYVPGYESKSGEPIPVPLNDDAIDVLQRWQQLHAKAGDKWSARVHRYVFVYRRRAPIEQVTTKMWRREARAIGLDWVTFHKLRHAWASWQVQAGTSTRILQWMGGWASEQMPQRYTHLDPGLLAQFSDRTLLRPRTDSVTVGPDGKALDPQVVESNGKGGTRTLDPGIMSKVVRLKAS